MNVPDFLDRLADGTIRIRGHRLRLIDIANRYEEGYSPEGILDYCDAMTLPLIHKAIAFYLENEPEVRRMMAHGGAAFEALEARSAKGPSTAELRSRLAMRSKAIAE
jgi:uncharacterized protein (DUF433 family)